MNLLKENASFQNILHVVCRASVLASLCSLQFYFEHAKVSCDHVTNVYNNNESSSGDHLSPIYAYC
jgi:hypothetical protein